jgi:hypothetical protein
MTDMVYKYLTDHDKAAVLEAHIRSLEHTVYSLEVSKIEYLADTPVDSEKISLADAQADLCRSKIEALENAISLLDLE